jgi:hypothetical protein
MALAAKFQSWPQKGVMRSMVGIRQGLLMAVGTAIVIVIVTTMAMMTVIIATIINRLIKPMARGPYVSMTVWDG